MPSRSRFLLPLLPIAPLLALVGLPQPAAASTPPPDRVHTSASEHRDGERLKTIPISRKAWGAPRSVMSLDAGDFGELRTGTRIEAYGDMEVSVCLKPNSLHRRPSSSDCAGKTYGYDPKIKAKLVIAGSAGSAKGPRTVAISPTRTQRCTQKQPNRNHHCVITVPWSGLSIDSVAALPCAPRECHINMVLSAFHKKAKAKNLLVIGARDDKGAIKQGKGVISTVLKGSRSLAPDSTDRGANRTRGRIPIASSGSDRKEQVIYSLRIDDPRAGQQFRIDAEALVGIGHLPYNALVRSELVLADSPTATRPGSRAAKVADSNTRLSAENGFNCTLGRSGHPSPCRIRKGGILSIRNSSNEPVYVNLLAGLGAQGTSTMYEKWKPSHRARVGNGNIVVERYRGTASCGSCK